MRVAYKDNLSVRGLCEKNFQIAYNAAAIRCARLDIANDDVVGRLGKLQPSRFERTDGVNEDLAGG
jgi:hypothetical protein